MDGTMIENQVIEGRTECLFVSSTKVQKLMRKSARPKGRTTYCFTIHLEAIEQQPPSESHLGDELGKDHREDIRTMLFDDFPELLEHVDSPIVRRP
jgi:hypothetical protein